MSERHDYFAFTGLDEEEIRQERAKARKLRNSRWWRQKIASGICHYCGKRFAPHQLTMDHAVALSRGGTSERSNLVPACKACNTEKKCDLPMEFRQEHNKN